MLSRKLMATGVATLLALGGVLTSLTPASADTTSGVVAVTGWAHLFRFPDNTSDANPVPNPPVSAFADFCANGLINAAPVVEGVANPATLGPSTSCLPGPGIPGPGPGIHANITAYSEPCAPVAGFADGTLTGEGPLAGTGVEQQFAWVRVGLVAVVELGDAMAPPVTLPGLPIADPDGAAVAVFVPLVGPGNTCPSPTDMTGEGGPINAYVAAVGAWDTALSPS
jgi:hypothetical protein